MMVIDRTISVATIGAAMITSSIEGGVICRISLRGSKIFKSMINRESFLVKNDECMID
jgi:hypothetical protein